MAKQKKEDQVPKANEGELSKLLSEYRTTAGLSMNQMADALCLSQKTLNDLENENFEKLAQPPYIRGYLRNYAKLANQEPEEIINLYESLRGADPQELEYHFKKSAVIDTSQQKSLSPILVQVFFLALLLGIIAGIAMIPSINNWIKSTWNSFSNQTTAPNIESTDNPLLTGSMPIPTMLPIPDHETADSNNILVTNDQNKVESIQQINQTEQSIDSNQNIEITSTTINDQEKNEESQAAPEVAVQPAVSSSLETNLDSSNESSSNGTINIRLVFNEDVWLRIKDSNKKTVFEGLNPGGNSKTLDLKKPLTFRVGNAPALSLFIDDELLDISSYIKGSVANFTLE